MDTDKASDPNNGGVSCEEHNHSLPQGLTQAKQVASAKDYRLLSSMICYEAGNRQLVPSLPITMKKIDKSTPIVRCAGDHQGGSKHRASS